MRLRGAHGGTEMSGMRWRLKACAAAAPHVIAFHFKTFYHDGVVCSPPQIIPSDQ